MSQKRIDELKKRKGRDSAQDKMEDDFPWPVMATPPSSAQKDLERDLRAMVRTETAARNREEATENADLQRAIRDA